MNRHRNFLLLTLAALAATPFGCSGGGDQGTPATTPAGTPTTARTSAMGDPDSDVTPTAGMTGRMGATGVTGAAGAMGAAGAAGATGKPANVTRNNPPIRTFAMAKNDPMKSDPFLITWKNPPPPPYVFDEVEPIRLASPNVVAPPKEDVEIRELPQLRVSGIMSGDGVYAIIEGGPEPEIVKPGSTTKLGYRVVSINADSVKLQRRQGRYVFTQVVPLTDVPPGGPTTAGFQGGMMGAMTGARPGAGRIGGGGSNAGKDAE